MAKTGKRRMARGAFPGVMHQIDHDSVGKVDGEVYRIAHDGLGSMPKLEHAE